MKLPNDQGWFSVGLYGLTVLVLVLMATVPGLRQDDLFKTLAQAIVMTGLINLAASFYFGASKPPAPAGAPPPARPGPETVSPAPVSPAAEDPAP